MRKAGTILRGVGVVWLLLLFAFSITPRKTLHDLLAHHEDSFFQAEDQAGGWIDARIDGRGAGRMGSHGALHIHKAGYYCHCDNLVVESPFMAGAPAPSLYLPVKDFVLLSGTISSSYRVPVLLLSSRGPPFSTICA